MAAIIFHEPVFATIVESGDKLYFYEVGTTTDLTVYTDFALSAAATQPVIADADGEFPVLYIDSTGEDPKVVLTDADDVERWTTPRYPIEDISSLAVDVEDSEAEIESLQGRVTDNESAIDTLNEESSDYEERITALEEEESDLPASLVARLPCAYGYFVGENNPEWSQNFGFNGDITYNSVGNYTVVFETARIDANYAVMVSAGPQSESSPQDTVITSKSTVGFTILTYRVSGGGTTSPDDRDINVVVFDTNNAA